MTCMLINKVSKRILKILKTVKNLHVIIKHMHVPSIHIHGKRLYFFLTTLRGNVILNLISNSL